MVTASNRAGMVYRPARLPRDSRELARAARRRAVTSCSSARTATAVARRTAELRFAPAATAGRRGRRRARSTSPTRSSARGPRSRNPNAGDVLVSAAPGVRVRRPRRPPPRRRRQPRLARWRATRRCRCSRSGSERRRRGSSTSRRSCSTTSASSARPMRASHSLTTARRSGRGRSSAARDIADERVLEAMERVPRELFVPERASARAYDDAALPIGSRPDDLAAVHGRAHLPRRSRCAAASACSTSAPAPATRRPCSRELADEVHTIERIPELAEQARREPRRGRLRARPRPRRRRLARPARAGAVRRDRRRRRRARAPGALYEQLEPRGRLVVPVGERAGQRLELDRAQPGGPGGRPTRSRAASSRSSARRASTVDGGAGQTTSGS